MTNFSDPTSRLNLLESVGPDEYNRLLKAHLEASRVDMVNGYGIRPVASRFGRLFMVEGTGRAWSTLEDARRFALAQPSRKKGGR